LAVAPAPAVRDRSHVKVIPSSYLTLDALPWANVYIKGKLVGETPIARLPVEAGPVDLTFTNPELSKTVHRHVHVEPCQNLFVKVSMR
jgi:serine/threonine-protein kinase